MFTGDSSGDFLYASLHRLALANRPRSVDASDGLKLRGVFITAVARCAPPKNRPAPEELTACRPFLHRELDLLRRVKVIVALGGIAYNGVRLILQERWDGLRPQPRFAHGARWLAGEGPPTVYACYHPSRQNTQTGRLTARMFDDVLKEAWWGGRR
jgi:uracil-DNA glycosylase family 4